MEYCCVTMGSCEYFTTSAKCAFVSDESPVIYKRGPDTNAMGVRHESSNAHRLDTRPALTDEAAQDCAPLSPVEISRSNRGMRLVCAIYAGKPVVYPPWPVGTTGNDPRGWDEKSQQCKDRSWAGSMTAPGTVVFNPDDFIL